MADGAGGLRSTQIPIYRASHASSLNRVVLDSAASTSATLGGCAGSITGVRGHQVEGLKALAGHLLMNSALYDLQEWYSSQCDGDWEHGFGIHIGTLDNPGWSLDINLTGTELEGVPFLELKEKYEGERNWLICFVRDDSFGGRGGPLTLERMIQIFLTWVQSVAEVAEDEQPAR